jgi:hypothetical protein
MKMESITGLYRKSRLLRWLQLVVSVCILLSDWFISSNLIGSISSDMISWCYKTFQSSFGLNEFIIGHFRLHIPQLPVAHARSKGIPLG